jgi:sodium/potassium-transporting ATPase subunit alpha
MDAAIGDPEKQALPPANVEDENIAQRAVAFPDDEVHEERRGTRPKGIEMKRELTKEDKELADAIHHREKGKKGEKDFDSVDIIEHKLAFGPLSDALKANFDTKAPGQSHGLSASEAKARYPLILSFYFTSPKTFSKTSERRPQYPDTTEEGTCELE